MNKGLKKVVPAIITALILLSIGYVVYTVIAPNNRMVPAFDEGVLNVVVGGSVVKSDAQPRIVDGEILMPINIIKNYIDPGIYWDEKLEKVTITTKDRVIRMKTGSLDAIVNNKPVSLNIPARTESGKVFIPIEFLGDFYNINITYIKANNVIVIDFKNQEKTIASPLKDIVPVRKGNTIHYPVLEKVSSGVSAGGDAAGTAKMRVFGENGEWYVVRTSDGVVGYVEKKLVAISKAPADKPQQADKAEGLWKPAKGKISMVWDYTWGGRPDLSKRKKIESLDVISPTSFQVVSEDGSIKNRVDAKYIEWAHENGYKVWALFSNSFGDIKTARSFLGNTDARDNAIRQLLAFSALYKLDGINIDFEEFADSDKDALTQFIKEASVLLKQQGLVVSVDINTKGCYDREALAEYADYIAVMSYDQHWSGGKTAGSVSEIPWSERTVKMYLESIPANKLILGIPFYTRLWKEETAPDGSINLSSKALSMEAARKVVEENKANVVLDETSMQFYAEYVKDGAKYKVWLEDANSIDQRSSLVLKYGIAGAAAWRLEFETEDIWPVISKNLKSTLSYNEWEIANKGLNRTYSYAK